MKVIYLKKTDAESIEPDDSKALISIRDLCYKYHIKDGWKNILILEFDDADPNEYKKAFPEDADSILMQYNLFSDLDAKKVRNFIEELPKEVKTIYVHCFAGRSRSPAIAQAIADEFGIEPEGNEIAIPNKFVYNKMKEVWNAYGN